MPRPALGPVRVGDTLLVFEARYYRSKTPNLPIEAEVTKVGRVWIELRAVHDVRSMAKTWRLRLDTQDDGTKGSAYHDQFMTPAQHAWQQKVSDARQVLDDAKIRLDFGSPWREDEDRLFALAEFVRAYDANHPT